MTAEFLPSGFLLIDKPQGLSSNYVLQRLKYALNLPKAIRIGHAGTLDPLATGMLLVAIGRATKFLSYLFTAHKTYQVTGLLGITTDTQDKEGKVILERPVPVDLSEQTILSVISDFTGEIQQIPPMYSALKHQGRALYQLAREGQEIPRAARKVNIMELSLDKLDKRNKLEGPEISLTAKVSTGTYIRTLVHDLGNQLGCGAHVIQLRRLTVGMFSCEQMIAFDKASLLDLMPIEQAFSDIPKMALTEWQVRLLQNGRKVDLTDDSPDSPLLQLYLDRLFLGLGRIENGVLIRERFVI